MANRVDPYMLERMELQAGMTPEDWARFEQQVRAGGAQAFPAPGLQDPNLPPGAAVQSTAPQTLYPEVPTAAPIKYGRPQPEMAVGRPAPPTARYSDTHVSSVHNPQGYDPLKAGTPQTVASASFPDVQNQPQAGPGYGGDVDENLTGRYTTGGLRPRTEPRMMREQDLERGAPDDDIKRGVAAAADLERGVEEQQKADKANFVARGLGKVAEHFNKPITGGNIRVQDIRPRRTQR